jgi:hypothetical protein
MAVNTDLQPIEGLPQANYFDLAHYDISNRGASATDAVLDVWWRAYLREPREPTVDDPSTYTLRLAKECGPATFFGAALSAICADAFARAKEYSDAGYPDDAAYVLGQRDAIYAALRRGRRF